MISGRGLRPKSHPTLALKDYSSREGPNPEPFTVSTLSLRSSIYTEALSSGSGSVPERALKANKPHPSRAARKPILFPEPSCERRHGPAEPRPAPGSPSILVESPSTRRTPTQSLSGVSEPPFLDLYRGVIQRQRERAGASIEGEQTSSLARSAKANPFPGAFLRAQAWSCRAPPKIPFFDGSKKRIPL